MSHDHGHPSTPTADVSVRPATPEDAEDIGRIQAALWQSAYAVSLPAQALAAFEPERFADVWRRSLENPPSRAYRVLVALSGPHVVGFTALGPCADPDAEDTDAEILVGGVSQHERRQGHGSRLLNATVDTLRDQDFASVRAWLLASDEATRTFLSDAGFVPDGAHRGRVVGPTDGDVVGEIRLTAGVSR